MVKKNGEVVKMEINDNGEIHDNGKCRTVMGKIFVNVSILCGTISVITITAFLVVFSLKFITSLF